MIFEPFSSILHSLLKCPEEKVLESTHHPFVTYEGRDRTRKERTLSLVMLWMENIVKMPLFRCQRCGECILSHTAFICSQRCPKRLRNGPCGGTSEGGYCEVFPERKCIWYRIYRRSRWLKRMDFLSRIERVHNWRLEKTSAWLNVFTRRAEPLQLIWRHEEPQDTQRKDSKRTLRRDGGTGSSERSER